MVRFCAVDPIHQARQGGRFPASCRTGDKNQTFGIVGKLNDRIRDAQLIGLGQLKGDDPDDGGKGTALLVGAHPVSGQPRDGKRKIIISPLKQQVN